MKLSQKIKLEYSDAERRHVQVLKTPADWHSVMELTFADTVFQPWVV